MCRSSWIATAALASVLLGCGGNAPPAQVIHVTAPPAAPTAQDSDVNALLVDLLAPQLCGRLVGTYIGLPGDDASTGPAAGADPTVGRWWIRRCEAQAHEGRLHLLLAGMGWTFVDRESSGFRVRQYLRFDASAELDASMEVGYDNRRKVASLWMRPGETVVASVSPRGLVAANATGVLSAIAGGLLSLTGGSADDEARKMAQEQGSTQLRERLSAGFTLTFDVERSQLDFMVGALERGQTPIRPYANEENHAWQVNQRSRVWPAGLDVIGPLTPTQRPQQLDMELEDGEAVVVTTLCAADLERYLDASFQGANPQPPSGRELFRITRIGGAASAPVTLDQCPTVLLLGTPPEGQLPVRVRYRVGDARPIEATVDTPAGPAAQPPVITATPPAQVRLQIADVSVRPTNGSGRAWDLVGGDADLYVRVTSLAEAREVDRTTAIEDRNEAAPAHWLPGAFRSEAFPLRFSVYDKDVTSDELIGTADLTAAQALQRRAEVILELHTQDETPARVGTLRLRLDALP